MIESTLTHRRRAHVQCCMCNAGGQGQGEVRDRTNRFLLFSGSSSVLLERYPASRQSIGPRQSGGSQADFIALIPHRMRQLVFVCNFKSCFSAVSSPSEFSVRPIPFMELIMVANTTFTVTAPREKILAHINQKTTTKCELLFAGLPAWGRADYTGIRMEGLGFAPKHAAPFPMS